MKLNKNEKLLVFGMSAFISIFLIGTITIVCIDKFVPKNNAQSEKLKNKDKEEKRNEFLDSQNPLPSVVYTDEKIDLPIIDDNTGKNLSELLKEASDGENYNEMSDILNEYQDEYELTDELKIEANQTQSIGLIKDMVKSYLKDKSSIDKGTMKDYINSSIYMIYDPTLYTETLFSLPQTFQTPQYFYNTSYVMECLSLQNNKDNYTLNNITEAIYEDYNNPIYKHLGDVPTEDRNRTTHMYLVDFTYNDVDYYMTLYKTKEQYMFALKIFTQDENTYSSLSTVEAVEKHYK